MRENPEFYEQLLDNLFEGVYYLDRNRIITFWNRGAEKLTGYLKGEVIGHRCSEDILCHVDTEAANLCELACPAKDAINDGVMRESEVLFRHKNGHRVPVRMRVSPVTDSEGKVIGAVQVFSGNSPNHQLEKQLEILQQQALLDPLTRVANRRAMEMYLKSRREELQRYGWPFGVLFIDIDHFKEINDRYGHLMGDAVLKIVAKTLTRNIRPFDVIGRWGGEEFLAIIANVEREELHSIAERYRKYVAKSKLKRKAITIKATVSIGATLCRPEDAIATLINRADELMYRCKSEGRNCVRSDVTVIAE